jgi:hypothetical protein
MDREDRQMTREEAQKVLDVLMPGLRLPDPRTEEEFLTELQPITELEELREEKHTETIIATYLMEQLNKQKKAIHELYERERALKNEMG